MTARQLAALIGAAAAESLISQWGGHELPRITDYLLERRARDEALRKYVDKTGSTRAAAQKFKLSERHVKRLANGY